MAERRVLPIILIVIGPLGIATWILAAHTVGDSISRQHSIEIGLAVALLAMMAAGYVLLLDNNIRDANPQLGLTLVICGTTSVVLALALQFYIAYLGGEQGRHFTEIMADNLKRGQNVNLERNAYLPVSVSAVAFLALFIGTWLAAMGIRVGVSRRLTAPAGTVESKSSEVPA
jgi:hypothetical protein